MAKYKVLPSQHPKIRELHKRGVSINGLAKMYGVTWGTIQFIVEPNKATENRERMRIRQAERRANESNEINEEQPNGQSKV